MLKTKHKSSISNTITILLYTENYEPGGGNRYVLDFIESIPQRYKIVTFSNENAFSDLEKSILLNKGNLRELDIWSHAKRIHFIEHIFLNVSESILKRVTGKFIIRFLHLTVLMKIFFHIDSYHNRMIFNSALHGREINAGLIFNGGYPAALSCYDLLHCLKNKNINTALSIVSVPASVSWVDKAIYHSVESVMSFCVNCNAIRNELVKTRNIPEKKFTIIKNCVREKVIVENIVKSDTNSLVIGCTGRIQYLKGTFVLLEAFELVRRKFPDIKLHLIGKVSESKKLSTFLKQYNLEKSVIIEGFVSRDSLYKNLAQFDVFVFPSLWEGLPYSVLEAMAVGLPIIASAVGGIPEVLSSEEGILVTPGDCKELSTALEMMVKDPDLRLNFGRKAKKKYEENFQFDTFSRNVEMFIDLLVKK